MKIDDTKSEDLLENAMAREIVQEIMKFGVSQPQILQIKSTGQQQKQNGQDKLCTLPCLYLLSLRLAFLLKSQTLLLSNY